MSRCSDQCSQGHEQEAGDRQSVTAFTDPPNSACKVTSRLTKAGHRADQHLALCPLSFMVLKRTKVCEPVDTLYGHGMESINVITYMVL